MSCGMTPDEFKVKMEGIANKLEEDDNDFLTQDDTHRMMDALLCEQLTELGYEAGVKVFHDAPKWYS